MFGTNVILEMNDKYYARHKIPPRDQIYPNSSETLFCGLKNAIKVQNLNLNSHHVVQKVKLLWRHQ